MEGGVVEGGVVEGGVVEGGVDKIELVLSQVSHNFYYN